MRTKSRFTGLDLAAWYPLATYAVLAISICLGYHDLGRWPVNSSSDPHGAGFELSGPAALFFMFAPVVAGPFAVVTTIALGLTAFSEMADTSGAERRRAALAGTRRCVVSAAGAVLLLPLCGRVLRWALD